MVRIRKTLEHVANGDCSVTLRLRDADDPMLKELAKTVGHLCERGRLSHQAVQKAADDLFNDLTVLQEHVRKGAPAGVMLEQMEAIGKKKAVLEKAVKSLGS
jgi:hypothetical protein